MFTISTIATPDPHHLLTLAHHRPCRVFLAGAVFRIPLAEAQAQSDGTSALFALDGLDVFGTFVWLSSRLLEDAAAFRDAG